MKKIKISEPEMITEAKATGRKRKLIIEILLFLLVFTIASVIESIPLSVAETVWMISSDDFHNLVSSLSESISNGEGIDIQAFSDGISQMMSSMPTWLLLFQLFLTAAVIITVIVFCKKFQKRKISSLGFRKGSFFKEYIIGMFVGILMISASFGIAVAAGSLEVSKGSFSAGIQILFLLGYMIQGMSEEVMCRGYFMVSIARSKKMWVAVLVNSVVFAMLHLANPGIFSAPFAVVNLVLSGVVFSLYMLKRGDIWGAAAIHTFWNFFQGNIFGIRVSGMNMECAPINSVNVDKMTFWNGGAFGLEGGFAVTIVMIISILVILFAVPEKREKREGL